MRKNQVFVDDVFRVLIQEGNEIFYDNKRIFFEDGKYNVILDAYDSQTIFEEISIAKATAIYNGYK